MYIVAILYSVPVCQCFPPSFSPSSFPHPSRHEALCHLPSLSSCHNSLSPSLPPPPSIVAITRCQYQDTTNSMETTFALYHNLILFQLTHRSPEIAQQTLNGLLNCSPHSPQLWKLTAQLQDWTTGSAMALNVLQSAVTNELTSGKAELYCYAAKLALSQVCMYMLCLVCLFDLACFFLSSFSSLI